MTKYPEDLQVPEQPPRENWDSYPNFPLLLGPTIPNIGRKFFIHSPSTILKLGTKDGESKMTMLARSILGNCIPHVVCIVTVPIARRHEQGLVLTRQPGKPLVELWPLLTPSQRQTVKTELISLLKNMRTRQFSYYGRPSRQPYILISDLGQEVEYVYCTSRTDWDDSRVQALKASTTNDECIVMLEQVQRGTVGPIGWDRPVLSHGDLSDRNILMDPSTLKVTGFLDWESANIMPAYYEYVAARLSGGHQPEWRKELLEILRSVLRDECKVGSGEDLDTVNIDEREDRYKKALAAWNAVVDVERIAQGYSDACKWTFETGMPDDSQKNSSAL